MEDLPNLTTEEAAAYVGRAASSLKSDRSRGKGPAFYRGLGNRILYRRSDLDVFVASCRVARDHAGASQDRADANSDIAVDGRASMQSRNP
jgi:hypothetical protein